MEAWRVGSGVERVPSAACYGQSRNHTRARRGERKNVCPSNSILTATGLLMEGNSLDPSDSRFAYAFDAQSRDFIKSGATVLESIIGCPARRAECLPTSSAPVATTLSPPSLEETVTDNA